MSLETLDIRQIRDSIRIKGGEKEANWREDRTR